ncbi:hypothetical protein [Pseudomonas alkylphenolica]|uniref:hypothetical protein n=1 Tax=Pseudomonas alkylphenolica TaxID=237609 RepID=UPI00315C8C84
MLLREALNMNGRSKNALITAISVFNSYLDITGQSCLNVTDDTLNVLMQDYYGFLQVEVDSTMGLRYGYFNRIERIFRVCFGANIVANVSASIDHQYMQVSSKGYRALFKNKSKLKAYGGDFAEARGGKKVFINLIEFRRNFGELADAVADFFSIHISRYPFKSAVTENNHFLSVCDLLCRTLKGPADFDLLRTAGNVYPFFEHYLKKEREHIVRVGADEKAFCVRWNCWMRIVSQVFIHNGLIADPGCPLPKAMFKTRSDEDNAIKDFGGLTNISIAIRDEQAADIILESFESDIAQVVSWCEEARAITMEKYHLRKHLTRLHNSEQAIDEKKLAERYPNLELDLNFSILASKCAVWTENAHVMSEALMRKTFGGFRKMWADYLGVLDSSTLLPFLYLLVREHPAITPAWIESFELYNKNGARKGIRKIRGTWVAVGKKPRKGSGRAIQVIILNKRSRRIFIQMLQLTKEARGYLKSIGSPDYRFLLIGAKSGFKQPIRCNLETAFSTRYRKSELVKVIKKQLSDDDSLGRLNTLFKRLSLRSLRSSCAIQIFLKTRSLKKASQALGHEQFYIAQMRRYIPAAFIAFMVNRWVRIFVEGMIFKAMEGSRYLFDAVSFNHIDDIDRFFQNHEWKPLPMAIVKGYGAVDNSIPKSQKTDRIYLPVDPQLCTLLMSIGSVLDQIEQDGKTVPRALGRWHGTATFLNAVKNTANESSELPISAAAIAVIQNSEPNIELVRRIKQVLRSA